MDHRNAAPRSAPPTSTPDAGSVPESSAAPSASDAPTATEAATTTTAPARPTPADVELLSFAQRFELTARDLYDSALAAGAAEGDLAGLYGTIRENHEEYASSISALLGVDAPQQRDDALFDRYQADFDTSDAEALAHSALELESVAVATHLDLLGRFEAVDSATTISGILLVESRHCTVLADAGGQGEDLDAMLVNTATPLDASGGSSSTESEATEPAPSTPAPGDSAPADSAPSDSAPSDSAPSETGSADSTEPNDSAPATTEA